MNQMTIRKMKTSDFFRINEFAERAEGFTGDSVFIRKHSGFQGYINQKYQRINLLLSLLDLPSSIKYKVVVAEHEGKLVGVCWARTQSDEWLVGIYVKKSHRKRGIGRKLSTELVETTKGKLTVTFNVENWGLKMFKSLGFEKESTFEKYVKNNSDWCGDEKPKYVIETTEGEMTPEELNEKLRKITEADE